MTLRARLVAALGLLLAIGLTVFGFGTYTSYSRSLYRRLDDQLQSAVPLASRQLTDLAKLDNGPDAGPGSGGPGPGAGPGGPAPSPVLPPSTYAELRDASGAVVASTQLVQTSRPKLPAKLTPSTKPFTTGSTTGSGSWRVLAGAAFGHAQYTIAIAIPTSEVTSQLNRLIFIEVIAGLVLLAALGTGSWLILRQGLRPLERMAESARSITGGTLSERVAPADGRTEVGQLGLALNTMLDEIETAFQERDATEQRLRQFLADASHELRTPLTSIMGFAELFRIGERNQHVDRTVVARRIEEESARMKTLVEDLLLLARLDQTRPSEREPVDLAVLAADACSDAVATDPSRSITLDAPNPVVVSGDRDHLRQAIANLMTNALTHTPRSTAIDVNARLDNGRAVVSVRDHGSGLDPDALAHAFDRFWQADKARVGTGAGLGLSIVSGIAREHGGTATVANDPRGGAVFTLELPVGT